MPGGDQAARCRPEPPRSRGEVECVRQGSAETGLVMVSLYRVPKTLPVGTFPWGPWEPTPMCCLGGGLLAIVLSVTRLWGHQDTAPCGVQGWGGWQPALRRDGPLCHPHPTPPPRPPCLPPGVDGAEAGCRGEGCGSGGGPVGTAVPRHGAELLHLPGGNPPGLPCYKYTMIKGEGSGSTNPLINLD